MEGFLLSLYPKRWRAVHESEYRALLEDTGVSTSIALDVLRFAFAVHIQQHQKAIVTMLCAAQYFVSVSVCMRYGLTENALWAPTNAMRTLGLALTVMPLIYAIYME